MKNSEYSDMIKVVKILGRNWNPITNSINGVPSHVYEDYWVMGYVWSGRFTFKIDELRGDPRFNFQFQKI